MAATATATWAGTLDDGSGTDVDRYRARGHLHQGVTVRGR